MESLPQEIATVDELNEIMSRPDPALVECMERLSGDIMILGAGGKMGPTIARKARRAIEEAGVTKSVIAVARRPLPELELQDIVTVLCDLFDDDAVRDLPAAENIVYLVGRKFGSTGNEPLTWATNVLIPYNVASTFVAARLVALSTGCVYPLVDISTGGATEETPPDPIGEYAQSCLGRERVFDFFSETKGERVAHIRLNYAVELRYGVLIDIAGKVWRGEPVDVTTGYANVIWQGDAASQILRALELASAPPTILNVTGPELFSVRQVAQRFAELFGNEASFAGRENGRGYLSNAALANGIFGNPSVPLGKIIEWTAAWVKRGGELLDKPTRFEEQDGRF